MGSRDDLTFNMLLSYKSSKTIKNHLYLKIRGGDKMEMVIDTFYRNITF